MQITRGVARFFEYARKRHQIYLRRKQGLPRETWTTDKILRRYRFTNVYRELDRTTDWFRRLVRDPLRDRPEVLLATVAFRMLNRIETGEAIFCQLIWDAPSPRPTLKKNESFVKVFPKTNLPVPFEIFLAEGDTRVLRDAILARLGRGPYVTGAYIISSPPGRSKLDGMLEIIGDFAQFSGWREYAEGMAREECTLEAAHQWLSEIKWFGKFHSYEIVTDLRHTALLERASDVMTWCNVGPGARRGLNRIMGRPKEDRSASTRTMLDEMGDLLLCSRDELCWSREWSAWEMREVEHTLCEFDKYERVRLGEGTPRGVYR